MLAIVRWWSWMTMISPLFDIIDEKFLHIVTANTHTVLLISLTAILTESVSKVVMEG